MNTDEITICYRQFFFLKLLEVSHMNEIDTILYCWREQLFSLVSRSIATRAIIN